MWMYWLEVVPLEYGSGSESKRHGSGTLPSRKLGKKQIEKTTRQWKRKEDKTLASQGMDFKEDMIYSIQASVGDRGCLSRILIFSHPRSRISEPRSNNNSKKGGRKFVLSNLFCSHKFHKIENYFIFEQVKERIWANWQRIKLLLSSQKYGSGIGVTRSRIRKKSNPDPGVKKEPDHGSGSATLHGK